MVSIPEAVVDRRPRRPAVGASAVAAERAADAILKEMNAVHAAV